MIEFTTESPESPMRFFTPSLYRRFNSEDDDIADAGQSEWDEATARYQHHLKRVLRGAPESVRDIARACFHDAVLSGMIYDPFGSGRPTSPAGIIPPSVQRPSPARLQLTLPGKSVGLVYLTWDSVIIHHTPDEWPSGNGPSLWLYDEVDEIWGKFGMYIHRILLSCGHIYEIPFYDVMRLEVAAPKPQIKPH